MSQLDIWPTVMHAFALDPGSASGSNLFQLDAPAVDVAVQTLGFQDRPSLHAIVHAGHRLHVSEGRVLGLYDLAADPEETEDLSETRPELVESILAAYGDLSRRDEGPRFGTGSRPLTSEEQEILQGLGYGGAEEDDE